MRLDEEGDEQMLLGGDDKRSCDACKLAPATQKVVRSNGFISINQFMCGYERWPTRPPARARRTVRRDSFAHHMSLFCNGFALID